MTELLTPTGFTFNFILELLIYYLFFRTALAYRRVWERLDEDSSVFGFITLFVAMLLVEAPDLDT